MERHPDIEIYIKRVDPDDLLRWIAQRFEVDEKGEAGETLKLRLVYRGSPLVCTIYENAAKGGYTSVSFEPNHTPWDTDEACAEEAFTEFQLEVRCVTGGWTNQSSNEGGWYRFTAQGRSTVNWLT